MESPALGIIIFMFLIFSMAQVIMIVSEHIETMKLSMDTSFNAKTQKDSLMKINNINCTTDDFRNVTIINVTHIGKEKLHLNLIDVFFPDRFPRNTSNRTLEITKELLDPGLWNPDEDLKITLYKQLKNKTAYEFKISNEFGVVEEITCKT